MPPAAPASAPPVPPRRLACVDVPALPLQLVLRAHPGWRDDPVVVVEDDRPQARILWANRHARRQGIGAGMRFQQAKALIARVHAAAVPTAALDAANTTLLRLLLSFSPEVEPDRSQPGLFFVDVHGLQALFTSLDQWAHDVHAALQARGFVTAVVVGFHRFAAFALARARTSWRVLPTAADEQRQAAAVPLAVLGIPPRLHDQLSALGIDTLGAFVQLPAADLRERFGAEAAALRSRATGISPPLAASHPVEPLRLAHEFELPVTAIDLLLATLAEHLQQALATLVARREALTGMRLSLFLEHAPPLHAHITTAAPTRDLAQLLELLQLRLGQGALAAPIERWTLVVDSAPLPREQLELLAAARRRDPAAAHRALARLRAAFGDAAVTRARLLPRHLPEQSFAYEPIAALPDPRAPARRDAPPPPLVRTLLPTPLLLGTMPAHEPEAWLGEHGAVQRAHGPFRLRHGWWQQPVERDYFFVSTDRGAILWLFHDRRQRRWYLHGRVD